MRVLAVLLVLLLTACAGTQESAPMCLAPSDSGTPFGQALQRSALHYGNKVTSEQLVLAGLSGLSTLDPTLKITRDAPRVVLQAPERPITWITVPSGWGMSSWREKVVDILNTAKQMSPIIDAVPPEKLQAALIVALKDTYPTPDVVLIPCPKAEEVVAAPKSPDHCFGIPYGQDKARFDRQAAVVPQMVEGADRGRLSPVSQPYVLMDRRLAEPPEITRIQRGYVEHWVGGFINDGLVSWNAIDLDRMELVRVQRRIYDQRAKLSRPFGDPELPGWDDTTQVRKWSDDKRVEMEVVMRERLREAETQAFVCVANGAWADRLPRKQSFFPTRTDTLAHTVELRDRTENNGLHTGYWRSIAPDGALGVVVRSMMHDLRNYPWPMLPKQSP